MLEEAGLKEAQLLAANKASDQALKQLKVEWHNMQSMRALCNTLFAKHESPKSNSITAVDLEHLVLMSATMNWITFRLHFCC